MITNTDVGETHPSGSRGRALLEAQGVGRVFGEGPNAVEALRGADFKVGAGELVAVIGPSGSGKSTLLTICGGLDNPTSGRVFVNGQDVSELDPVGLAKMRRREVGYVFQELNLLPALTAVENVAVPLELDGMGGTEAHAEALKRLEEVGLDRRVGAFPDDLSGGERQRVSIARAMVGSRKLLLADEPTGALDSHTGAEIIGLIWAACDQGAAAVVVTHDEAVAEKADRVLHMNDGEVVSVSNRTIR